MHLVLIEEDADWGDVLEPVLELKDQGGFRDKDGYPLRPIKSTVTDSGAGIILKEPMRTEGREMTL